MSAPMRWAVGDRCIARGQAGVVDSLGPACATVRINAGRVLFVGLDELEMMPLPVDLDGADAAPPLDGGADFVSSGAR